MPTVKPQTNTVTAHSGGIAALSETLAATLALFPSVGELTADQVREQTSDDVGRSAMNNRLERLRTLGLLQRRRVGHEYHYARSETPRSQKSRAA